jgi:hypothetical protein
VLVFYVVVSLLLLRLADEISLLSVAVAAAFGLAMSARTCRRTRSSA